MEPFDREELSQQELDDLLQEWRALAPSPHLRAALFPEGRRPWWRRIWTVSIRLPLPVACCLGLLLAAALWRTVQPAPPASKPTVVAPAGRREDAVEPDRTAASKLAAAHGLTFNELKPVDELRPRIIRRKNAKN
jgi:hypothetical protein